MSEHTDPTNPLAGQDPAQQQTPASGNSQPPQSPVTAGGAEAPAQVPPYQQAPQFQQAPQQAYAQPQAGYQAAQPGIPMAQPMYGAPVSKKGLAITALVVGIVAFLSGWVPVLGMIVGAVAVVFGIIALVKKQSKALALTGLILGAVALVVSLIFTIIAGAVTTAVINEIEQGGQVSIDGEESGSSAGNDGPGSEENPVALGSVISGSDFDVIVNSVTLGADEELLALSRVNTAAEAGMQYAVVNLTVTYTGTDSSIAAFVTTEFKSASDGEEYYTPGNAPIAPEPSFALDTLNPGDSETANLVLQIPSDATGVIGITPGIVADTVYVKMP